MLIALNEMDQAQWIEALEFAIYTEQKEISRTTTVNPNVGEEKRQLQPISLPSEQLSSFKVKKKNLL